MKLLDVHEDAPIQVRRKAVQKNTHIVDWYFCRRMEQAIIHLIKMLYKLLRTLIVMNFN